MERRRRPEESKGAAAAAASAASTSTSSQETRLKAALNEMASDCSICFEEMLEPCTLPCKHNFCMGCIKKIFKQKKECALCRYAPPAHFKPEVNTTLQTMIRLYKEGKASEYIGVLKKSRRQLAEEAAAANNVKSALEEQKRRFDYVDLDIVYGNRHRNRSGNDGNTHECTMFVMFTQLGLKASELIEKVRFGLDTTIAN